MKVMNYDEGMRKSPRSLFKERTLLAAYVVTSKAGAYSNAPDRPGVTAAPKRYRSLAGQFQAKKRGLYRMRGELRQLDVLEQTSSKVKRHLAAYVLDVGEYKKIVKKGARHVRAFTILRSEDNPRSRDDMSRETVDYRELAQETLSKLAEEVDSEAVDYLATVFAKLSTGKIPKIAKGPRTLSREEASAASNDPLAAARARGRRFALEQYERPENLGLLDARDYAGRNERSINEQRQNGELYALLPPGKTRGFRYPQWQFDAPPERLKAVLRPFVDAKANCWVIHSFMMRKRDALHGKSPADVILDDKEDTKSVIELAEGDLTGEQGAL